MLLALLFFAAPFQNSAQPAQSATVRIHLDHNRIIIPVSVYLSNGKMKQVNAWVDNGTSVMSITARLAKELEITTSRGGKDSVAGKPGILIGGMHLKIDNLPTSIELEASATVGSGLHADINLPSTILHNYDIIIDYPARLFTIAMPGMINFRGKAVKAFFCRASPGLLFGNGIPGRIPARTRTQQRKKTSVSLDLFHQPIPYSISALISPRS